MIASQRIVWEELGLKAILMLGHLTLMAFSECGATMKLPPIISGSTTTLKHGVNIPGRKYIEYGISKI